MGIVRQAKPRRAASFGLALAAVLACAGLPETAAAQGVVKSIYGDWQIRCDTPPGAQSEQCALIQSVTAEDRPSVGLTVIVLKTADQKSRLMRVLAPLGVLLPSGLGLKINQADIGRAGFVRCLPNGCVAEVIMDDNLIKHSDEPQGVRRRIRQAAMSFLPPRRGGRRASQDASRVGRTPPRQLAMLAADPPRSGQGEEPLAASPSQPYVWETPYRNRP